MINPKEIKREFISILLDKKIKKVLDLGCGELLLSKRFLEKGSSMTGIDIREPSEIPKGAVFVKGNILNEDFGEGNDLIISSLIIHLFNKEKITELFEKIKNSTSKGGYNLIICMSNKDKLKQEGKFFSTKEEILSFYSGWKIEKQLQDETEIEEHSNLPPHRHDLIFLILKNC